MLIKNNISQLVKLNNIYLILLMVSVVLFASCNSHQSGAHQEEDESSYNEVGEESGTQFGLNETYDNVRNGVRLILSYNKESSFFKGTVNNITAKTIRKVRVEVHLSNGVELGPTTPFSLASGEKQDVTLSAEGQEFETWSTHAESGSNENGHSGEESNEHGNDGEGEHDKEGQEEHN
ncbi:MAG: hypothetical protein K8R74_04660 [Bacteroidales bacterium]|nr:hypothetical protein [Bacteroidales bacterium]